MVFVLSSINKVLEKLGLSDTARRLYIECLGRGPLTLAEISMIARMGYDTVTHAVRELQIQGLMKEIPEVPPRYEAVPPYKLFVNQFVEYTNRFSQFEASVKELISTSIAELSSSFNEFQQSISETLKGIVNEISTDLEKSVSSIFSMVQEAMNETTRVVEDLSERIVSSFNAQLRSSAEVFGNQIREALKRIDDTLEKLSKEFSKSSSEYVSQITEEVSKSTEEINNLSQQMTSTVIDNVNILADQLSKGLLASLMPLVQALLRQ